MEDFPFRPSYDVEKVANSFLSTAISYVDSLDHTKASLKLETLQSPLQLNHDFRKPRLNSFEAPIFFPFKEEDRQNEVHDQIKAEPFGHEFGHQGHIDFGFDFPITNKLQDYAVDYYRINRSRGPSFNLGPGRKNSEDIFAHGFDLLNYCSRNNYDQHNAFMQDMQDTKMNPNFIDDLRTAPVMQSVLPGSFGAVDENVYQQNLRMSLENALGKEIALNNELLSIQQPEPVPQYLPQNIKETQPKSDKNSDSEPKPKKKRKTNNNQEAKQDGEGNPNPSLKKSKSEVKKSTKTEDSQPKPTKTTVKKMPEPKAPKSKKSSAKQNSDSFQVKAETESAADKEEKSTEASSINVSPVPKKEDLPGLFKSKSSIVNTFGHFKKPETAQELLGGLALPAEVEEYINNSKIFNQIKAPIVRKIGTLTIEERRLKIEKYLEKRKRRSWNKRVNYDCRKKVADNRLRIKGRFVTKEQAFGMLEACGIFPDPEKITNTEIKDLLNERFGGVQKKKENTGEHNNHENKGNGEGNIKMEGEYKVMQGEWEMEQETSSFGSQEDSLSENYLKD